MPSAISEIRQIGAALPAGMAFLSPPSDSDPTAAALRYREETGI
jgi:hypothetical protein